MPNTFDPYDPWSIFRAAAMPDVYNAAESAAISYLNDARAYTDTAVADVATRDSIDEYIDRKIREAIKKYTESFGEFLSDQQLDDILNG